MARTKVVRPKKKKGAWVVPDFDVSVWDMKERIARYDAFRSATIEVVMKPNFNPDSAPKKFEFVGPLVGKRMRGTFIQCVLKKKKNPRKQNESQESA